MKKYEQLMFDRSHTIAYIKGVLNDLLLKYENSVYVACRRNSFSQYIYYILYDISSAIRSDNTHLIFFGKQLNSNTSSAFVISIEDLFNKNIRIFVDNINEV